MKIRIKAGIIDLTPSIKIFIEEKLGGLEKYIEKLDEQGAAQLRVEIGRTTRHHRKGDVYAAAADLRLPKKVLRAEESGKDIRTAVDMLKDTLRIEIEKFVTSHGAQEGRNAIRERRGK